jgi:hypothetical protein
MLIAECTELQIQVCLQFLISTAYTKKQVLRINLGTVAN